MNSQLKSQGGVRLLGKPTSDRVVAGSSYDSLPIINPLGDYEQYLPVPEWQNKNGYESMNCVRESFTNCIETTLNVFGVKVNLSARFLGFTTGDCGFGTWMWKAAFFFGKFGCCLETDWPFTTEKNSDEFCRTPGSEAYASALKFLKTVDYGGVVEVGTTIAELKDALKRGPVWFCNTTHAMMIYKIDDRIRVFDTYGDDCKVSLPLEYANKIEYAAVVNIKPKSNMIDFPKNSLVVVVEDMKQTPEERAEVRHLCGRYMNIDNTCLFDDDAAKILTELMARNATIDGYFERMPVVHCFPQDILGVKFVNLKREPVVK